MLKYDNLLEGTNNTLACKACKHANYSTHPIFHKSFERHHNRNGPLVESLANATRQSVTDPHTIAPLPHSPGLTQTHPPTHYPVPMANTHHSHFHTASFQTASIPVLPFYPLLSQLLFKNHRTCPSAAGFLQNPSHLGARTR